MSVGDAAYEYGYLLMRRRLLSSFPLAPTQAITKPRGDLKVTLDGFPITPRIRRARSVGVLISARAGLTFVDGVQRTTRGRRPKAHAA